MKTIRRLVAVGVLMGSYHVGMSQSSSIPAFNSDAEKEAWVEANPEKYNELSGKNLQWNSQAELRAWAESHPEEHQAMLEESKKLEIVKPVYIKEDRSNERFASDAEKEAWIKANPAEYAKMGGDVETNYSDTDGKPEWVKDDYNASKRPVVTKAIKSQERFSSEAEKEAWIKANPEEYERLNSGKTNK